MIGSLKKAIEAKAFVKGTEAEYANGSVFEPLEVISIPCDWLDHLKHLQVI